MSRTSCHWLYSAIGLYLLSIAGALAAPVQNTGDSRRPEISANPDGQNIPPLIHKQFVGFSLNVHYTDQLPKYFRAIDMVADLGCNSLQILTPAFQTHGASTQISIPNKPGRSPQTHQLLKLLRYAQQRHLKTLLMPTILFTQPRGNEWRGKISPEDWDAWWQNYTATLLHFAKLAQKARADVFCVGSELLTTERQTLRWTQLITQIRKVYHGQLIYSTNWDHYHVPTFWNQLDYIGISGYWSITPGTSAPGTPETPGTVSSEIGVIGEHLAQVRDISTTQHSVFAQRWQAIQQSLQAFATQTGKPILITELGYPCLPWGLKDPWNYVHDAEEPATPDVQAMGYEAFTDNWQHLIAPDRTISPSSFAGVMFYAWDPYNGGPKDPGYGVWGKPAQAILKQWLKIQISP